MSSTYESIRQSNIKRNEAFLHDLGLTSTSSKKTTSTTIRSQNKKTKSSTTSSAKQKRSYDSDLLDVEQISAHTRPTRRSLRIQGEPAESYIAYLDDQTSSAKKIEDVKVESEFEIYIDDEDVTRHQITSSGLRSYIDSCDPVHAEEVSDEAIAHCVYRMQTMSNKRLATRIKMIARACGKHSFEKLLVFYYALQAAGLMELAQSAKQFLDRIGVEVQVQSIS